MNNKHESAMKIPINSSSNGNQVQWKATSGFISTANPSQVYLHSMNNQAYSKKKRKMDNQSQAKLKKQRFHWDGSLHFQFLKQLFKYGLDNIPVRKIFDTLRQYSNDITYDFVEKMLNKMRDNMEGTLDCFSLYYNQALHYQESYAGADTVVGKFSLYPFAPRSINQLCEECQRLKEEHEPSIQQASSIQDTSNSLLQSSNYNRIAVPKIAPSVFLSPLNYSEGDNFQRENAMDTQIQLHQDMLFQNRYIVNRNINNASDPNVVSFGDMFRKADNEFVGFTSSEDDVERNRKAKKSQIHEDPTSSNYDLSLITDVLAAQNDRFVEHVDRYLAEYPSSSQLMLNENERFADPEDDFNHMLLYDSMYNNENDVFDFLK